MEKLSSTAKKIDVVLHILFWVMIAACIVAVAGALAPLVLRRPAPDNTEVSLDLDFVKFHLARPTQEAAMVLALLGNGMALYCIKLIRNILKPMVNGEPFHNTVCHNLKKLGWVSLIGGFAVNAVNILMKTILTHGFNLAELLSNDKIANITFNYSFDLTFLAITAGLFLLSYIFRYGTQLQQLSDETL